MEPIVIICFALIPAIVARHPLNAEGEIRHFLLNQANHSPRDRPVLNASDTVHVGLCVRFHAMLDLNEKDQVLTTASRLNLYWRDERMTWDPSNFSGVELVTMYVDEIWTPTIFLVSSFSDEALSIVSARKGSILLTSEGEILLGLPVVQTTQCPLNITYFPFDVQTCPFRYFPENMLTHQVHLYTMPPNNMIHNLHSTDWELLNVTLYDGRLPVRSFVKSHQVDYQSWVIVCVHLERDPNYYTTTLLVPSTCLCLMGFITFLAPPDSGERVSLGISMVLGLTVFQLLIASTLPTSSKEPPLLRRYLTATFLLTCLTVPLSMINIRIAFGDSRLRMLRFAPIRNAFLEILPRIVFMPTYRQRIQTEHIALKTKPRFNNKDEVITLATGDTERTENQVASLPPPSQGMTRENLSTSEKAKLEARTVALVMDKLVLTCFLIVFFAISINTIVKFNENPGMNEESCLS